MGHLSRPGHRVITLTRCETRVFRFSKKCPKCKTYIWNAEMTKVIFRCLLLDWNHWMSVHAMNFYFYLWLLKILRPENTSSHISRHLEFIIEQGHRVNWVSGSLDSRVTGSLSHKMWTSSISDLYLTSLTWQPVMLKETIGLSSRPWQRPILWPRDRDQTIETIIRRARPNFDLQIEVETEILAWRPSPNV